MAKDTKIIHFTIVDGTVEEVQELKKVLATIKDKLSYDIEFLITNDKVESMSVTNLIKSLTELYKREKVKK